MITKEVVIDEYHAVLGQYAEAKLDGMTGTMEIDDKNESARFIPDDPSELPGDFDDVLFSYPHMYHHDVEVDTMKEFVDSITK